ncbi:hypothetical protein P3S68_001055 [Capsicum galapagoense]
MSSIFKETDAVAPDNQNEVDTNVVVIAVPGNDDSEMRSSSAQKEVDTTSLSILIGVLSYGSGQDDEYDDDAQRKADPDEGFLKLISNTGNCSAFKARIINLL